MNDALRTTPKELFELLDYCGLKSKDITDRLGIGRALLSHWRTGRQDIPPSRYSELLGYASETMVTALRQWVRTLSTAASEDIERQIEFFETFVHKMRAAQGARDLTPLYTRLSTALGVLHATTFHEGPVESWSAETLDYVAAEGRNITALATAIQHHRQAAEDTRQHLESQVYPTYQAFLADIQQQKCQRRPETVCKRPG
jgi:hypothetical protein